MIDKKEFVTETIDTLFNSLRETDSIKSGNDFKELLFDTLNQTLLDEPSFSKEGQEIATIQRDVTANEEIFDLAYLEPSDVFLSSGKIGLNERVQHTLLCRILFVDASDIKSKIEQLYNEGCKFFDSKKRMLQFVILVDNDPINLIKDTDLLMFRRRLHQKYQNIEDYKLSFIIFNTNAKEIGYIDI